MEESVRSHLKRVTWLLLVLFCAMSRPLLAGEARLVAREGKGALYQVDGHRMAILAGTPEEMGRQHGVFLKKDVAALMNIISNVARSADNLKKGDFFAGTIEEAYKRCEKFIPDRYLREIDALADAAGLPRHDVRVMNIFPELFHCSGFALMGKATRGGELLHGRILDYMTEIGLQGHAVTFVCLPKGRHAFVNVGYTGFIGSVSGMNERKIAFGEMGGRGEGLWDGMPMGFLMRCAMEEADTLEEAVDIFRKTRRTCEYHYVISDGNGRKAVGLHCTPDTFEQIGPGEKHPLLPAPVEDAVLLSAGDRYGELVKRVKEAYGRIDVKVALALMNRPVAMKSNLHNVLFAPERLTLWVAHAADRVKNPKFQACYQPYVRIDVRDWLKKAASLKADPQLPRSHGETRTPAAAPTLSGTASDAARPPIAPAEGPEMESLLKRYRLPREEFQWRAALKANSRDFAIYELQFPSPVETPYVQNNTVHCEYYRVHGSQARAAVVVLHILDGRFVVARLVCTTLASAGTDALMLKLPFYGERRPPGVKRAVMDPTLFQQLIVQGVADVRRASALLAGLEHVPDDQVGVCGVSLGGFIAAVTAGVDGHYERAAFVLAGGGLYDVLTKGQKETAAIGHHFKEAGIEGEDLAELLHPIDPLTFARRLKPCKVLMINVTGDEVIPAEAAQALATAAGVEDIVWYPGTSHTSLIIYAMDALQRVSTLFAPGAW